MAENESKGNPDLVAVWDVPLSSGLYSIEFEHGTTTGKRVIRINGKEILRHDWMFKLVGYEEFVLDSSKCKIRVDPYGIFAYRYCLEINGKPFRDFIEIQSKILKTWTVPSDRSGLTESRIVLEKSTLDLWVNGKKVETDSEFVDGGTRTHFLIDNDVPAILHAFKTGKKKQPIIYSLTVNDQEIPESQD